MDSDDVNSLFFFFLELIVGAGVVSALFTFRDACYKWLSGQLPSALSDRPTGDQPAFKQYLFRRGFLDVYDIVKEHWFQNRVVLRAVRGYLSRIGRETGCAVVPIWIVAWIAILGGTLGAIAVDVAIALFLWAVILACTSLDLVLMLLVRNMEYVFIAYHRFVNHCPHCYAKIALPVYRCACGRLHNRLLPGSYGIFLRRCGCGCKLPTSYLWGRHKIESFCPACKGRLEGEAPTRRPVLLAVIAGRSAGKTTYQVALLNRLQHRQERGEVQVDFVVAAERARYESAVAMLRSGSLLPQTLEMLPKALQLNFSLTAQGESTLGSLGKSKLRLHLFDAAGESYQDEQWMQQLLYLRHCHGLILLLDPLSVPSVCQRLNVRQAAAVSAANPAEADPQEVYDRLLEFLEQHRVRTLRRKVRISLAIVLTKTDACGIAAEISGGRAQAGSASGAVRTWLVDNQLGGMVDKIEAQFATYRYFACSALAAPSSADGQRPGDLADVEEPFFWLLRASKICGPAAATPQNV